MASQQPIGTNEHGFRITLPNTAAGARLARKQLIVFMEHFRLSRQTVDDVETMVGEALANAAEHGFRFGGTLRVEALLAEDRIEVLVSDDGIGFSLQGPILSDHPPTESPRGYGLFLMRALADELEFRDDGKTGWFLKRFLAPKSIADKPG